MKLMWCWRCKEEVPMLDDEEYSKVYEVYISCIKNVKKYREKYCLSMEETPWDWLYIPVTLEYNRIVGIETDFSYLAILKHPHRISSYGPPCKVCGKPLSSQKAKMCMACKSPVDQT